MFKFRRKGATPASLDKILRHQRKHGRCSTVAVLPNGYFIDRSVRVITWNA